MTRRYDSQDAKRRILSACVRLFIEKGYHATTMALIIRQADVSASTFQNIFRNKEGVLMELTQTMFEKQFSMASGVMGETMPPVYLYAAETAIQLTLAELNENLREIYVEAYTRSSVAGYICENTAKVLYQVFGSYLPECTPEEFYEMDIGTSGLMRGYMARKCDEAFPLERKLERFLTLSLRVFCVPQEEREKVIAWVLGLDIRTVANGVMQQLFQMLAMKYHFTLGETTESSGK